MGNPLELNWMQAVFEIAVPLPVGVVCPCLQLPAWPNVTVESGDELTEPNPALTPVERYVSLPLNALFVMQSDELGLETESGTQQPVPPVFAVLFQTSTRKY